MWDERQRLALQRAGKRLTRAGRPWAAPSFVVPGTVGENCRFLAGLAPEVGLLFFETQACMAYGPQDLPPELAGLGLRYHVHLPLDLPWERGVAAVWAVVRALVDKAAFLAPWGYVLHPPGTVRELEALVGLWTGHGLDPAALLLENVRGNDLTALLAPSAALGLSLCLDLGHLMAYNQPIPELARDWQRVRMLHLCAPGPGGRHRPLAELDGAGRALLARLVAATGPRAVLMLEIFDAPGLFASAALLADWMEQWNAAP
ncbi:cobamide remodeling phosphodiesterase CbiR [Desulfocurvus vexinensis]|uniref:cobamide remodeling phosphodiesterase CbiR n=1 Tax=Desulfocurvus vexinensis TaxID=399548 RepID=UPI0004B2B4AF|nr:cobamide remodeling phosphodiesterase CbiR [Desulfocurvus vexinensis]